MLRSFDPLRRILSSIGRTAPFCTVIKALSLSAVSYRHFGFLFTSMASCGYSDADDDYDYFEDPDTYYLGFTYVSMNLATGEKNFYHSDEIEFCLDPEDLEPNHIWLVPPPSKRDRDLHREKTGEPTRTMTDNDVRRMTQNLSNLGLNLPSKTGNRNGDQIPTSLLKEQGNAKPSPLLQATDGCPVIEVFGSCLDNGRPNGRGGIGVYWGLDNPNNVGMPLPGIKQTSNRALLEAAIVAIEQAKRQGYRAVELRTNGEYLIKGGQEYLAKWKQYGWKRKMRSSKAPLNVDQWQRLDSARDGITVAYTYKQKLNQARRLARKGCRNNKLEASQNGSGAPRSAEGYPIVQVHGSCLHIGTANARGGVGVFWGHGNGNNLSQASVGNHQTSNRAFLEAAILAIEQAKRLGYRGIKLHLCNEYLIKGATMRLAQWKQHGWTRNTEPLANADLWQKLDKIQQGMKVIYERSDSEDARQLARKASRNNND